MDKSAASCTLPKLGVTITCHLKLTATARQAFRLLHPAEESKLAEGTTVPQYIHQENIATGKIGNNSVASIVEKAVYAGQARTVWGHSKLYVELPHIEIVGLLVYIKATCKTQSVTVADFSFASEVHHKL